VALAIAAIALLGISSLLGSLILGMVPAQVMRIGDGSWSLGDLKVFFILGVLGVGLFFPMFLVGLAIPFPPLIFGASFAWWLFTVGAAELTVARFLLPKVSSVRLRLSSVIAGSFSLREAAAASVVFLILYAAARLVEVVLATDLRVVTPLLSSPWVVNRVLLVPVFLPFFLFYFLADGLYLYEFRRRLNEELGMTSKLVGAARAVLLNIGPYLVVLGAQYAPMFALGVRPLAGMAGFLLEFLWGIVPLFIVSSVFSWWFHRRTSMIGAGAVLNALVFAWSAASIFPFRG